MLTVARASPFWTQTKNSMLDGRWAPSYCLLSDGKSALVAGGYSYRCGWCTWSADIYDEKHNKFIPLNTRLNTPRDFATATLLPDGSVLIAGGFNDTLASLNSAELYVSSNGTFQRIAQHMLSPRELHTATLLNDGTVLIAGGLDLWIGRTQNTAEIYNPVSQTFTPVRGRMSADRFGQAACRLADGRVLIAGGTSAKFGHDGYSKVLASAEIYDPKTEMFSDTRTNMSIGRDRPTANLLPDGNVLIAGGQGPGGEPIRYAELYDPANDTFTDIKCPQVTDRMAHCTGTLPDGRLILTGGWCATTHSTTSSVEEFVPTSNTFIGEPNLPFSSHDACQIVFPDGTVLVAGGKSVKSDGTSESIAYGAFWKP